MLKTVDDGYIGELAAAVTGARRAGGRRPPHLPRKLVADVLDRVDQFADFDPRRHYALTLTRAS